jgi:hypothetical protein
MKKLLCFIAISLICASVWADGLVISAAGGTYAAAFVSYSGNTGSSVTQVTVAAPTGIQNGRMIGAFVLLEAVQTSVSCPGFTQVDVVQVDGLHEGRSFYKEASSESGDYTWTIATSTSGISIHMFVISKSGGAWVVPTSAGYHAAAGGTSVGVSTGNITTQNNSVLLCGFSHDTTPTLDTPATGMTQGGYHEVGTMRGVSYYQAYGSGATVTKNVVWGISERNAALGMVFYAQ